MFKIFVVIIILFKISSNIIPEIIYGEDIKYDKNNNKFTLNASAENGDLLFYIITDIQNTTVNINIRNNGNDWNYYQLTKIIVICPGIGKTLKIKEDVHMELSITAEGKEEGTFMIFPLYKIRNVDLSKKYGKMVPAIIEDYNPNINKLFSLRYIISKLPKDHVVIFNYLSEFDILNYSFKDLSNPFRICHGNVCKDKVDSYIFKANEEYTIDVQFQNLTVENKNYTFLTGYSFYDKNDKNELKF